VAGIDGPCHPTSPNVISVIWTDFATIPTSAWSSITLLIGSSAIARPPAERAGQCHHRASPKQQFAFRSSGRCAEATTTGDLAKQLVALLRALGVLLGASLEEGLDIVVTLGVLYVGVIGLGGLESVILDADQVVMMSSAGLWAGAMGPPR
jgi:hypothetical protein